MTDEPKKKTSKAQMLMIALLAAIAPAVAMRSCTDEKRLKPLGTKPPDTEQVAPDEPTIITVYVYKDAEGNVELPKDINPERDLIDEMKRLLKLENEEEQKLVELIENEKFDEVKKYLEELLEERNIKVEYVFLDPNRGAKILRAKGFTMFKDAKGQYVTRFRDHKESSPLTPEKQKKELEARLEQADKEKKIKDWLETIEEARSENNNRGVQP